MSFPVVKIRKHEFAKFLRESEDVATQWIADNIEFERCLSHSTSDVDELMDAIDEFGDPRTDYLYIFNANIDNPDEAWGHTVYSDELLPEVTSAEMGDYVIRCVMGDDFLYFACSLEEASCVKYTTLLPARNGRDYSEVTHGNQSGTS